MTVTRGPVFVAGVPDRQGGATLRHLRRLGIEARPLFRERDVRPHLGPGEAEPRTGGARFDDPDALEVTLRGANALVLILEDPDIGPAERVRYGRTLIDAAVAGGVQRIVYVASTGADHHRLACDVGEETVRHLESRDVPATVLRPATFMEEVPWYWLNRFGRELVLTAPFVAGAHLPLVARDDVAAFAALTVARPEESAGGTLDVAGDTRTPDEIAELLEAALGERVRYEEVQVEGVFVYQEASTQVHDVARLRERYPRLHTFEGWLDDGGLELCRREVGPAAGRVA